MAVFDDLACPLTLLPIFDVSMNNYPLLLMHDCAYLCMNANLEVHTERLEPIIDVSSLFFRIHCAGSCVSSVPRTMCAFVTRLREI